MTAASISKVLQEALAFSQMTSWELGRRADVKVRLIEAALQDASRVPVEVVLRIADALGLDLVLVPAEPKRRVGAVLSVVDVAIRDLAPHSLVYVPTTRWVLALDLEVALIGDTANLVARPGLHRFLTCCRALVTRLIVFSVVEEAQFREVASLLASKGCVPPWFSGVEYVHRLEQTEDLAVVLRADPRFTLLVTCKPRPASMEGLAQWIAICRHDAPLDPSDRVLDRVLEEIARRTTA